MKTQIGMVAYVGKMLLSRGKMDFRKVHLLIFLITVNTTLDVRNCAHFYIRATSEIYFYYRIIKSRYGKLDCILRTI